MIEFEKQSYGYDVIRVTSYCNYDVREYIGAIDYLMAETVFTAASCASATTKEAKAILNKMEAR